MKNYLICTFVFLFPSLFQSHLFNSRKLPEEVKQQIDAELKLTYRQLLEAKTIPALRTSLKALEMSQKNDYSFGKFKSYYYVAQILCYTGSYKKAMEYIVLSEKEGSPQDSMLQYSEVYRIKGQLFHYLGFPEKALIEFKKGLLFVRKSPLNPDKERLESLAYENLGFAYTQNGNADSAYTYMVKNQILLSKMDESKVFRNLINLYAMLGGYFSNKKNYPLAESYFCMALNLTQKYKYWYTSFLYMNWGKMEMAKGNPDAALVLLRKSLANIDQTKLRGEAVTVFNLLSSIYKDKGNRDSAKVYQDKMVVLENENLKAQREGVETAMSILLAEERQNMEEENNLFVVVAVACILLFCSLLGLLGLRKHQKIHGQITYFEEKVEVLEQKVNEAYEGLIEMAKNGDSLFLTRMKEVYPTFVSNLFAEYPHLITSEFWLCSMIFLNFSSKEIAAYSFVEHRSIQIRKGRLRKKLNIPSSVDLYQFMFSFNEEKTDASSNGELS
ncbi:MAG: hypothetical protein QM654_06805 [Dysgonamonadaceae bacterium]